MPQKLCQQRLPKPPKYQTQWAFHGILMWPLYSNLTLVVRSFLYLFFLLLLLPLLFGSFTSSFFHQLLEYPSRHGGKWCSSLLTVPLSSTCGGLLIPAPLLSSTLLCLASISSWYSTYTSNSSVPSLTHLLFLILLRNHCLYSNPNKKPWYNLMLL